MISLTVPLNLDDSESHPFLEQIQGNILKGHGRPHAAHVMVRFTGGTASARRWLAGFARTVTSARSQYHQIESFKARGDGGTFATVALSASGYDVLDVPEDQRPQDAIFRAGMKGSATLAAGDLPVQAWEPAYQGTVDAMVLLADQDAGRLDATLTELQASLKGVGKVLVVERGERLTREDPKSGHLEIEHFGFADGISQPRVVQQEIDEEKRLRGNTHWEPGAPLGLLISNEPGGFGSYFVFRKLEQHVRDFHEAEAKLADALGLQGLERDLAGAMAVGRFRNGYPVIPTKTEPSGAPGNDFNFDQDRFGAVCPLQSHIRRSNPRGDLTSPGGARPALTLEVERSFRIARRGITYGKRPDLEKGAPPSTPVPNEGVGLLFMSTQSRLLNFEIQQAGSDVNDFPIPGVGVDAVMGHNPQPLPQRWTRPPNAAGTAGPTVVNGEARFTMANLVTLKGGEYFFLPSLPFLRGLASATP
ncbi:MAG TPA: hypothetical protein VF815_29585 [Myxococcaceae bacterium]|jgi:deferrochelatase/peroxidase EfeB